MNVADRSNSITVPAERPGRDTVPPHISEPSPAARSGLRRQHPRSPAVCRKITNSSLCDDEDVRGGLRRLDLGGVILAALLGAGLAACSSGPSTAATALCGSVFAAPPPNVAIAVSNQAIKAGENSGYANLDRDARNWASAIDQHNEAASQSAQRQLATDCTSLKIPLGTLPAP